MKHMSTTIIIYLMLTLPLAAAQEQPIYATQFGQTQVTSQAEVSTGTFDIGIEKVFGVDFKEKKQEVEKKETKPKLDQYLFPKEGQPSCHTIPNGIYEGLMSSPTGMIISVDAQQVKLKKKKQTTQELLRSAYLGGQATYDYAKALAIWTGGSNFGGNKYGGMYGLFEQELMKEAAWLQDPQQKNAWGQHINQFANFGQGSLEGLGWFIGQASFYTTTVRSYFYQYTDTIQWMGDSIMASENPTGASMLSLLGRGARYAKDPASESYYNAMSNFARELENAQDQQKQAESYLGMDNFQQKQWAVSMQTQSSALGQEIDSLETQIGYLEASAGDLSPAQQWRLEQLKTDLQTKQQQKDEVSEQLDAFDSGKFKDYWEQKASKAEKEMRKAQDSYDQAQKDPFKTIRDKDQSFNTKIQQAQDAYLQAVKDKLPADKIAELLKTKADLEQQQKDFQKSLGLAPGESVNSVQQKYNQMLAKEQAEAAARGMGLQEYRIYKGLGQNVGAMTDKTSSFIKDIQSSANEVQDAIDKVDESLKDLANVPPEEREALQKELEAVKDGMEGIKGELAGLMNDAQNFKDKLPELNKFLDKLAEGGLSDKEIKQFLEQFGIAAGTLAEMMAKLMELLKKQLAWLVLYKNAVNAMWYAKYPSTTPLGIPQGNNWCTSFCPKEKYAQAGAKCIPPHQFNPPPAAPNPLAGIVTLAPGQQEAAGGGPGRPRNLRPRQGGLSSGAVEESEYGDENNVYYEDEYTYYNEYGQDVDVKFEGRVLDDGTWEITITIDGEEHKIQVPKDKQGQYKDINEYLDHLKKNPQDWLYETGPDGVPRYREGFEDTGIQARPPGYYEHDDEGNVTGEVDIRIDDDGGCRSYAPQGPGSKADCEAKAKAAAEQALKNAENDQNTELGKLNEQLKQANEELTKLSAAIPPAQQYNPETATPEQKAQYEQLQTELAEAQARVEKAEQGTDAREKLRAKGARSSAQHALDAFTQNTNQDQRKEAQDKADAQQAKVNEILSKINAEKDKIKKEAYKKALDECAKGILTESECDQYKQGLVQDRIKQLEDKKRDAERKAQQEKDKHTGTPEEKQKKYEDTLKQEFTPEEQKELDDLKEQSIIQEYIAKTKNCDKPLEEIRKDVAEKYQTQLDELNKILELKTAVGDDTTETQAEINRINKIIDGEAQGLKKANDEFCAGLKERIAGKLADPRAVRAINEAKADLDKLAEQLNIEIKKAGDDLAKFQALLDQIQKQRNELESRISALILQGLSLDNPQIIELTNKVNALIDQKNDVERKLDENRQKIADIEQKIQEEKQFILDVTQEAADNIGNPVIKQIFLTSSIQDLDNQLNEIDKQLENQLRRMLEKFATPKITSKGESYYTQEDIARAQELAMYIQYSSYEILQMNQLKNDPEELQKYYQDLQKTRTDLGQIISSKLDKIVRAAERKTKQIDDSIKTISQEELLALVADLRALDRQMDTYGEHLEKLLHAKNNPDKVRDRYSITETYYTFFSPEDLEWISIRESVLAEAKTQNPTEKEFTEALDRLIEKYQNEFRKTRDERNRLSEIYGKISKTPTQTAIANTIAYKPTESQFVQSMHLLQRMETELQNQLNSLKTQLQQRQTELQISINKQNNCTDENCKETYRQLIQELQSDINELQKEHDQINTEFTLITQALRGDGKTPGILDRYSRERLNQEKLELSRKRQQIEKMDRIDGKLMRYLSPSTYTGKIGWTEDVYETLQQETYFSHKVPTTGANFLQQLIDKGVDVSKEDIKNKWRELAQKYEITLTEEEQKELTDYMEYYADYELKSRAGTLTIEDQKVYNERLAEELARRGLYQQASQIAANTVNLQTSQTSKEYWQSTANRWKQKALNNEAIRNILDVADILVPGLGLVTFVPGKAANLIGKTARAIIPFRLAEGAKSLATNLGKGLKSIELVKQTGDALTTAAGRIANLARATGKGALKIAESGKSILRRAGNAIFDGAKGKETKALENAFELSKASGIPMKTTDLNKLRALHGEQNAKKLVNPANAARRNAQNLAQRGLPPAQVNNAQALIREAQQWRRTPSELIGQLGRKTGPEAKLIQELDDTLEQYYRHASINPQDTKGLAQLGDRLTYLTLQHTRMTDMLQQAKIAQKTRTALIRKTLDNMWKTTIDAKTLLPSQVLKQSRTDYVKALSNYLRTTERYTAGTATLDDVIKSANRIEEAKGLYGKATARELAGRETTSLLEEAQHNLLTKKVNADELINAIEEAGLPTGKVKTARAANDWNFGPGINARKTKTRFIDENDELFELDVIQVTEDIGKPARLITPDGKIRLIDEVIYLQDLAVFKAPTITTINPTIWDEFLQIEELAKKGELGQLSPKAALDAGILRGQLRIGDEILNAEQIATRLQNINAEAKPLQELLGETKATPEIIEITTLPKLEVFGTDTIGRPDRWRINGHRMAQRDRLYEFDQTSLDIRPIPNSEYYLLTKDFEPTYAIFKDGTIRKIDGIERVEGFRDIAGRPQLMAEDILKLGTEIKNPTIVDEILKGELSPQSLSDIGIITKEQLATAPQLQKPAQITPTEEKLNQFETILANAPTQVKRNIGPNMFRFTDTAGAKIYNIDPKLGVPISEQKLGVFTTTGKRVEVEGVLTAKIGADGIPQPNKLITKNGEIWTVEPRTVKGYDEYGELIEVEVTTLVKKDNWFWQHANGRQIYDEFTGLQTAAKEGKLGKLSGETAIKTGIIDDALLARQIDDLAGQADELAIATGKPRELPTEPVIVRPQPDLTELGIIDEITTKEQLLKQITGTIEIRPKEVTVGGKITGCFDCDFVKGLYQAGDPQNPYTILRTDDAIDVSHQGQTITLRRGQPHFDEVDDLLETSENSFAGLPTELAYEIGLPGISRPQIAEAEMLRREIETLRQELRTYRESQGIITRATAEEWIIIEERITPVRPEPRLVRPGRTTEEITTITEEAIPVRPQPRLVKPGTIPETIAKPTPEPILKPTKDLPTITKEIDEIRYPGLKVQQRLPDGTVVFEDGTRMTLETDTYEFYVRNPTDPSQSYFRQYTNRARFEDTNGNIQWITDEGDFFVPSGTYQNRIAVDSPYTSSEASRLWEEISRVAKEDSAKLDTTIAETLGLSKLSPETHQRIIELEKQRDVVRTATGLDIEPEFFNKEVQSRLVGADEIASELKSPKAILLRNQINALKNVAGDTPLEQLIVSTENNMRAGAKGTRGELAWTEIVTQYNGKIGGDLGKRIELNWVDRATGQPVNIQLNLIGDAMGKELQGALTKATTNKVIDDVVNGLVRRANSGDLLANEILKDPGMLMREIAKEMSVKLATNNFHTLSLVHLDDVGNLKIVQMGEPIIAWKYLENGEVNVFIAGKDYGAQVGGKEIIQTQSTTVDADGLLQITDGLTEQKNYLGLQFELERVIEIVRNSLQRGRTIEQLQDDLLDGIVRFTGDADRFDDIALRIIQKIDIKPRPVTEAVGQEQIPKTADYGDELPELEELSFVDSLFENGREAAVKTFELIDETIVGLNSKIENAIRGSSPIDAPQLE